MRSINTSFAQVSFAALAIALVTPTAASAQATPPADTTPPGSPQSSTQDDDATAAPQQQNDTAATAAESAPPLQTGTGDNQIVITGTRIARPEFAFPNPVQAYTAETMEQAGTTNITDFLSQSPALIDSDTSATNAGSNLAANEAAGANFLNLRNLGTNRTLVLVDGRRHVAGYHGTAAVDINTIPVDLIDRVDVLTGGVSAVYGADGVSGVVNFIMKRDFDGFKIRAQNGISQRHDAEDHFASATWGKNFNDGRGNITLSYEFDQQDRFSQLRRLDYAKAGPTWLFVTNPAEIDENGDKQDDPNVPDFVPVSHVRWADTSPGSAVLINGDNYDFDGTLGIPTFYYTGEGTEYDPGEYISNEPYTIGGSSTPQDIYFGDYRPYNKRHIFNVLSQYEFSPAFRVFAEGKYVRNKAYTLSQPSYDLYVRLFNDNAYLNEKFGPLIDNDPNVAGTLVLGRDNFDYGIRRADAFRKTIRTVLGADGDIGGHAKYEVSWTFGQVKSTSTGENERIRDRYYAALDAVKDPNTGQITCRINLPGETMIRNMGYIATQQYGTYDPDLDIYLGAPVTFKPGECVPLNNLGYGSPSKAALDWILTDNTDHASIRQNVLSGSVSGDTGTFLNLPGGPVGYAVGAEYRKESSHYTPGDLAEIGQLLDASQTSADKGSFNVKELFAELNFPILSKVPFADTLSIGAAGRLSKYSTIGTTKSWSVNGVYAPIRAITFRGTISQAVRAPNLTELFGSPTGTYEFINDPCGIDRITDGTQYREANCTTALTALGIDPTTFDPAGDQISPANTSLLGRTSGNRSLSEETARTWTAGIVLRPPFIPNFQIAGDWYSIRIKKAINTPTAQQLAELCVDQPTLDNIFCANMSRDAVTGYVSDFLTQPANVAAFSTAGLDVSLAYRFRPAEGRFGTFNLRVTGNYLHKLQFVPTVGAEIDNNLEESLYRAAKYSANGDLTWTKGPLTLNYGINYFSKTLRYTREETEADPDITAPQYIYIKPSWEHEIQAAYDIKDRVTMYAGIDNLWDAKPDIGVIDYPVSAVGRFFYIGVRAKIK